MPALIAILVGLIALVTSAILVLIVAECEMLKHRAARKSRHRILRARRKLNR